MKVQSLLIIQSKVKWFLSWGNGIKIMEVAFSWIWTKFLKSRLFPLITLAHTYMPMESLRNITNWAQNLIIATNIFFEVQTSWYFFNLSIFVRAFWSQGETILLEGPKFLTIVTCLVIFFLLHNKPGQNSYESYQLWKKTMTCWSIIGSKYLPFN